MSSKSSVPLFIFFSLHFLFWKKKKRIVRSPCCLYILPPNFWVSQSGKLLLVLASTVILGSESCGSHDHILLSHDSGSQEIPNSWAETCPLYIISGQTTEKTLPPTVPLLLAYCPCMSVCVPPIVARQLLGKHVPTATNTHPTIELLDASFSMRSVSYQRKVGD
jgi:hypothetical protein